MSYSRSRRCSRAAAALALALAVGAGGCTSGGGPATGDRPDGGLPAGVQQGPDGIAFYQAPEPPAGAKAGDLIWARRLDPPAGSEGFAILHWSTAVDGRLVPVSSVLFRPAGPAPATPRPILAWAHGIFGIGDRCAPSQGFFRGEGPSLPVVNAAVRDGLVFVATDFEGLGPPGDHPFMVSQSAARNVLDSIRAAAAFTGAGADTRSVVLGQSQGASAALVAAEIRQSYAPDVRLAGVAAVSPLSRLDEVAGHLSGGPFFGYVPMLVYGFQAAYPRLAGAADVLTADGRSTVRDGCAKQSVDFFAGRTEAETGTAAVLDGPEFAAALAENEPARTGTDVPILVVHGEADETVPVDLSRRLVSRYCELGATVTAEYFPGLGHADVFNAAQLRTAAFVRDRVGGAPAPTDCGP